MKTKKNNNKSRFRLPMSALVTYLLLACLLTTGVTLAKFISTSGGSDMASVASFEVFSNVTSSEGDLSIDCTHVYSSTATYVFDVVNNGEVAVGYKVIVTLPHLFAQEGIEIRLNDQSPQTVGGLAYMAEGDEIVYTFENDEVIAPRSIRQGVTLSFIGDRSQTYYDETVEGVKVKVVATQID